MSSPRTVPAHSISQWDTGAVDQRLHRRYPVDFPILYKLLEQSQVVRVGSGRICNVSQGGVFLQPDEALPMDSLVELSVPWPSPTGEAQSTTLVISGRIVRRQATGVGIRTEHYEYRMADPCSIDSNVPRNGTNRCML